MVYLYLHTFPTLDITMPSAQYSIALSNETICKINHYDSKVTALALGKTEIILIDSRKLLFFTYASNLYTF